MYENLNFNYLRPLAPANSAFFGCWCHLYARENLIPPDQEPPTSSLTRNELVSKVTRDCHVNPVDKAGS